MIDEATSSTSSLPNTRICRICHIVERGTKSSTQLKGKGKAVEDDSIGRILAETSKFLIGFDFRRRQASDDEMIAPCNCKGTMRFVHRGCLNQWREVSGRNDSFQRCEQCFALYRFNEGALSKLITSRAFILAVTAAIFWSWILASMLVTTSTEATTFNLLPKLPSDLESFPFTAAAAVLEFVSKAKVVRVLDAIVMPAVEYFNSLMDRASRLFYGLVFVAITEFIFLTPSFLFSFNILFCVWRIQKYELFFDKWLLAGLTLFGVFKAWRSIEGTIMNIVNRVIKLWFLEVQNQADLSSEKED